MFMCDLHGRCRRSPIPMPTSSNLIPRTSPNFALVQLVHCLVDSSQSTKVLRLFWELNGLHVVMGFALFKRWGQMWRHCVRSRRGFASQSQPLLREMFQHILFTYILHRFTMWVKINGNSEPWSRLVNTITVLLRYSLEICCWGWSKSLCPITPWFRPRVCLLFSTKKWIVWK